MHHRVAAAFRDGPVFLAGDAGHVHSPVGAQGMNTGLQDAHNLAFKLADVVQGRAPDAWLDRYQAEVHAATLTYLDGLTSDELARVVDEQWDPPVTAAVWLVSVIDDCAKHLGQADYVLDLADRRDTTDGMEVASR